jgi:hypothetical protein
MEINREKHVWEGWTVGSFIDSLSEEIKMIMTNQSWKESFKTREEIKRHCMENQPYYKKYIPEVVDYFVLKYNIK